MITSLFQIEEVLQFICLLLILVKIFFFNESRTLTEIAELNSRIDDQKDMLIQFRKREANALIIAVSNRSDLDKNITPKLDAIMDFFDEEEKDET